jgi:glycosyltransferase involved in cell wall biosynthesis
VCSDAGSLPELVRHGDNGLVSAYDDVSGIANNLEMVLTSAAERQRMGRRGRGYAQQFCSEAIAKAIYEVYKDLLKCNR